MPVDQSGENILFVLDGKTVEAHVQIQYSGDPARFAWIVPMPAVPTVTVGSQQLFTNLLQSTVPSFGFTTQRDFCPCVNCGGGRGGASGAGGSASFVPGVQDAGIGVTVLFQKTVGSFEVTGLSGHKSQEVIDWLTANGYQNAVAAPSILDYYVAKGSVFVAVKLTAGTGSNEIHPLVFKYVGTEPCIPLELTAVAAVEDMGVRAFFLGTDRVVSTNFAQITLNPARFDWAQRVRNYNDVVSLAVNEGPAGGHAFVTEYAGASSVVQRGNLSNAGWDESAFVGIDPRNLVDALSNQGLLNCFGGSGQPGQCTPFHPLIIPLLHEFLPPPAGLTDGAFYSCVKCNEAQANLAAFDPQAFKTALVDRVFTPGRHATAMLQRWPYLTRLFTTISPYEMTADPLFEARSDLPEVALPASATQRITTTGQSGFALPDGRNVATASGAWPAFTSAMPWAEKIEQYPAGGKPVMVLADKTSAIDAELGTWNKAHAWPAPPPDCSAPGAGGATSGAGGAAIDPGNPFFNAVGKGGKAGSGGASGSGGAGGVAATSPASSDSGGCSVSRPARPGSLAWASLLLGAVVAGVRRRRAAQRLPM
jgi:hypothetical protein